MIFVQKSEELLEVLKLQEKNAKKKRIKKAY